MSAADVFLKTELVVKSYRIVCRPIKNIMLEQIRYHRTNGYSTKIINSKSKAIKVAFWNRHSVTSTKTIWDTSMGNEQIEQLAQYNDKHRLTVLQMLTAGQLIQSNSFTFFPFSLQYRLYLPLLNSGNN